MVHEHGKVEATQFLDASVYSSLQRLRLPNVDIAETEDFCSLARSRDVLCHIDGLLFISTDDTSVCAEVDESSNLRTTCERAWS